MDNLTCKGKVLSKTIREGFGVSFEVATTEGVVKLMAWNTDVEKNKIPMVFNIGDTLEIEYGCHNEKYNNYKVFGIKPLETIDFENIRKIAEKKLSDKLNNYITSIKDEKYKDLVLKLLSMVGVENFYTMVAARSHHHNYPTGLLQHTIECLDVVSSFANSNPELDRDLLVASAVIHDIGKCKEYKMDYKVDSGECTIDYTEWAEATTHTSWVNCLAVQKGLLKLARCVGAHMGKLEWGATVAPESKEEYLLHLADMISSKSGVLTRSDFIERYKPSTEPEWDTKTPIEDIEIDIDEIPF